jgi:hypothetical protein
MDSFHPASIELNQDSSEHQNSKKLTSEKRKAQNRASVLHLSLSLNAESLILFISPSPPLVLREISERERRSSVRGTKKTYTSGRRRTRG